MNAYSNPLPHDRAAQVAAPTSPPDPSWYIENVEADFLMPWIGMYTLGFLGRTGNDLHSLGSGVLARLGRVAGVVTCSHVLEGIEKRDKVYVVCFGARRDRRQGTKLPMAECEVLSLGAPPWGRNGPDVGFLRIPDSFAGTLGAVASVLNLDQQCELHAADVPDHYGRIESVTGIIEEWTRKAPERVTDFRGLISAGVIVGTDTQSGFDLVQFRPRPDADFISPHSYGGTSGAGLWRLYLKRSGDRLEVVQRRLRGVAFYEEPGAEQQQLDIRCHGPESLYGRLVPAIRDRWMY